MKKEMNEKVEQGLLSRLKLMGYLLVFFCICCFAYTSVFEPQTPRTDYGLEEAALGAPETPLSLPYIGGIAFAIFAALCFLIVYYKNKKKKGSG